MSDTTRRSGRASAIVRLVIWSLVAVILTGVLSFALVKDGSPWFDVTNWSFSFGRYDGNIKDGGTGGDAVIAQRITRLEIDWVSGSVDMIPTEEADLSVREVTKDGESVPSDQQMRWLVKGDTLMVDFCDHHRWQNMTDKRLTVMVPADWLADMDGLAVNSVSADVTVSGTSAWDALSVNTVSGNVSLTQTRIGGLNVNTTSGDIRMEGTVNEVDADTVSGDVRLTLGGQPHDVEVNTVSGNVTILLDQTISGFRAELDAVSGRLYISDFEGTWSGDTFRYGDGGTEIQVDSVSGSVYVQGVEPTPAGTTSPETSTTETTIDSGSEPSETIDSETRAG